MHMHRATDWTLAAVLALLGACGVSVARADPPSAPDAAPAPATAAASATSAPAASAPAASTTSTPPASAAAAPAAAPAKETDAQLEKRLTNSGYKAKMRNGTKVWCKREGELGSRLGGQEVCGTPDELRMVTQQNQDAMKDVQKLYNATLK
jgi:hypothetical protein